MTAPTHTAGRLKAYLRFVALVTLVAAAMSTVIVGPDILLHYQGRETTGVVVAKRPYDHGGMLQVEYDAGSQRYGTRLAAGRDNPEYEDIRVGDRVILTYVPWDPGTTSGGRRPPMGWDLLGPTLGGFIASALLGLLRYILFPGWFERREREEREWQTLREI